jgi:hypothetical protein
VYPFIEAEKVEQRNVAKTCTLLEVSRSAFYEWHRHIPSARQVADDELAVAHRGDLRRLERHLRLAPRAPGAAPAGGVRAPGAGRSHHAPQGLGRAVSATVDQDHHR